MYLLNKKQLSKNICPHLNGEDLDNFWAQFAELHKDGKIAGIKKRNILLKYNDIVSDVYDVYNDDDYDTEFEQIAEYTIVNPVVSIDLNYRHFPKAELTNAVWEHASCVDKAICFGDGNNEDKFDRFACKGNIIAIYYLLENIMKMTIVDRGFHDVDYDTVQSSSSFKVCDFCYNKINIENEDYFKLKNGQACKNCHKRKISNKDNLEKYFVGNFNQCTNCGYFNLKRFGKKIKCEGCKYEY